MTLLEATAERLFGLILIGGVGLAVVVYIIRKQLRNPQNDPVTVIGLWVLSFVVFFGIVYSAIAAKEGFALIFVLLVAVPVAVLLGLAWTPTIANTLTSPLTTAFSGDNSVGYEGPTYGQALAKRKRGQYKDAVEAVEIQLEQHPGDFDGLMLKASIQAENLNDLPAAVAQAWRVLHGVSEGVPGVTVDKYGTTLLVHNAWRVAQCARPRSLHAPLPPKKKGSARSLLGAPCLL